VKIIAAGAGGIFFVNAYPHCAEAHCSSHVKSPEPFGSGDFLRSESV
jgi:hypothetical protein